MAYANVQTSNKLSTSTGQPLSWTPLSAPTLNNLLTQRVLGFNATPDYTPIAANAVDSSGTPKQYALDRSAAAAGLGAAAIYSLVVPAGLTTPLKNTNTANYKTGVFDEWSGNVTSGAFDTSNTNSAAGTPPAAASSGTINTAATAGLGLAVLAFENGTTDTVVSSGANWTQDVSEADGTVTMCGSCASRTASMASQTGLNETWTVTSSSWTSWRAVIADYLAPAVVSVQKAIPSADVTDGNWLNESGSNTNLFASIDEADTPSDADYIQSAANPSSDLVEYGLSTVTEPTVDSGHILRYRIRADQLVGGALTLDTELRQGANALSTPALFTNTTEVASTTEVTVAQPLSTAQAASITDYSALRIRHTATQASSYTLPTFVGVNTSGVSATTGTLTVPWPTTGSGAALAYQTNDIALLFVECQGGDTATLSTANGFVQVTNSPQSTGSAGTGSKLSVWWCRATSASMSSPIMTAASDHQFGIILTFRGCTTSGNPFDITSGGVKASATTTTTTTGVTTTLANALIVEAITKDLDSTAAFASAQTNAALASITERFDAGTVSGNGGGIAVHTGTKAAVGATGATSVTVTSCISAFMTISLVAPNASNSKARVTWSELEVPMSPLPLLLPGPTRVRFIR